MDLQYFQVCNWKSLFPLSVSILITFILSYILLPADLHRAMSKAVAMTTRRASRMARTLKTRSELKAKSLKKNTNRSDGTFI